MQDERTKPRPDRRRTPSPRIGLLVLAGAVIAVTPGCLELAQEGRLHRDGALDLVVRFSVEDDLLDRLKIQGSPTTRDLEDLVETIELLRDERACRSWFEKRQTSLARHTSASKNGRHDVLMELKTADFRNLLGGTGDERKLLWFEIRRGPAPETAELRLGPVLPTSLAEVLDVAATLEDRQRKLVVDTLRTFTAGTTVSLRMSLPGQILDTDLPREGAGTIVLAVDFSRWKTVEDLRKLFRPRRVVWDAAGLPFALPTAEPDRPHSANRPSRHR